MQCELAIKIKTCLNKLRGGEEELQYLELPAQIETVLRGLVQATVAARHNKRDALKLECTACCQEK